MNLQESLTVSMDKIHWLIERIEDKAGALANDKDANWGNVGSLHHAVEELENLAAFLGGSK
jgi:orotate phosphoribosyltransferase-like protein